MTLTLHHRSLSLAIVLLSHWSFLAFSQTTSSTPVPVVTVVGLASPIYPPLARVASIWGDVVVAVTIRPDGSVDSVALTKGHAMLKDSALDSARQTRFDCRNCTTEMRYELLYSFRMVKVADCCSTLNVAPTVEERKRPDGSPESWQTHVIVSVPEHCICDLASTAPKRGLKCLYLWRCSTH
jgi:TonB family protein